MPGEGDWEDNPPTERATVFPLIFTVYLGGLTTAQLGKNSENVS